MRPGGTTHERAGCLGLGCLGGGIHLLGFHLLGGQSMITGIIMAMLVGIGIYSATAEEGEG